MGIDEDEDLEELFAKAPHLVSRTIVHQRIAQSPMETRGVVAQMQGDDMRGFSDQLLDDYLGA